MGYWPENLSVHTAKGIDLDAVLPEAGMLNITKAVLGSGRVEAKREVLAAQTEVSEPVMECPVEAAYLGDGKAKVTVIVNNEKLAVAFDCWQIGLHAIDQEGADTLFFLQQATNYDHIPTAAQTPLVLRHTINIEHSNMLGIDVTPPEYMSVPYKEFVPVRDDLKKVLKKLEESEQSSIIISSTEPNGLPIGGIWYDTSDPQPELSGDSVVIANAVVSDTEPEDKKQLWFDTTNG